MSTRDSIFFSGVFGFLVGIFVRSFFSISLFVGVGIAAILILVAIWFLYKKSIIALIGCFICIGGLIGIMRYDGTDMVRSDVLSSFVGQTTVITGRVVDDPDVRTSGIRLVILPTDIATPTERVFLFEEKNKILVRTDQSQVIRYGDIVSVRGKLQYPENFETDTGKEFDYISYLKKDGIFFTLSYGSIESIVPSPSHSIRSRLFDLKHAFIKNLSIHIPQPEDMLASGILFGTRAILSPEWQDAFIRTGTIHIVALSGYNVSIVAEGIMRAFRLFLSALASSVAGVFAIISFVVMTGASSTAIRAGIMGGLALAARLIGRPYDIARALLVAVILMVFINPKILVFDVSFQLSVIATLGMIYIAPILSRKLYWIPFVSFREIVSATIAAQIAVLPFILWRMGTLSLIALPVNILILPFMPIAMFTSAITSILGLFSHVVAFPFGFVSYSLLHFILSVIKTASTYLFASFTVKTFPLWLVLILYIGMGIFIYRLQKKSIEDLNSGQ